MGLPALATLLTIIGAGHCQAADACQDYVKAKDLPPTFKLVSKSALGQAELHIVSDGKCTCNDLPAVQRGLGNEAPASVNWACDASEGK